MTFRLCQQIDVRLTSVLDPVATHTGVFALKDAFFICVRVWCRNGAALWGEVAAFTASDKVPGAWVDCPRARPNLGADRPPGCCFLPATQTK